MKELKKILDKQLKIISPSKDEYDKIQKVSTEFQLELRKNLKKQKINAEVFLGGSLAKDTLVKKDIYDIDIFVRFDKSYRSKKISELLNKLLPKAKKVHGSRDYFQQIIDGILIEVIPVIKIDSPSEATNVTDLSYFHVNYLAKKIRKNKKLIDEIRLAKTFTHANNVYGAESYIHGFSGYALELLVIYYKKFTSFIKAISKLDIKKEKLIIDEANLYKNKEVLLKELNPSKKTGPIILIDPTYKERNAASSLSKETLFKFQNDCKLFLKNPSEKAFIPKSALDAFKDKRPIIISIKTNKQAGDIAGTKSKKFTKFFLSRLKKEFEIIKDGFGYNEVKNTARLYLLLEKKKPSTIQGPPISLKTNLEKFKKIHHNTKVKEGHAFTIITHNITFDKWFKEFIKKDKKFIKEMGITKINLV